MPRLLRFLLTLAALPAAGVLLPVATAAAEPAAGTIRFALPAYTVSEEEGVARSP